MRAQRCVGTACCLRRVPLVVWRAMNDRNAKFTTLSGVRPSTIVVLFVAVTAALAVPILTHPLPPLIDYINNLARAYVDRDHRLGRRLPALLYDRVAAHPQSDDGSGGAGPAPVHEHLRRRAGLHARDLRPDPGGTFALNRALFGRWSVVPIAAGHHPLQRSVARRRDELRVRHRAWRSGRWQAGSCSANSPGRGASSCRRCSSSRCSSATCSRSDSTGLACWPSRPTACGPRGGSRSAPSVRFRRHRCALPRRHRAAAGEPDHGPCRRGHLGVLGQVPGAAAGVHGLLLLRRRASHRRHRPRHRLADVARR